jgi:cytochrome c biogenesis protein CcmG/thiol:disulfide interchange protein DsbE
MRRLSVILSLALLTLFFVQQQLLAQADKPKPEEELRKMMDYLGGLPAFGCRMVATLDIKADGQDPVQELTKMTARLERPNRLALIVDEGKMGLTVVSDGKQLTQCLGVLKRYVVSDTPATYAEMTQVGVPLKPTILGTQGWVIPTGGDDYFKRIVAGVEASKYIGTEKIGGVACHHLRFAEKHFDWDAWIEDGKRPVVHKILLDMSKRFDDEKATVTYTVAFSDWNVAPKFTAADFVFKAPADAKEVDELIEPDPPHPLLGKPAPPFKTVDVDGRPFDLKSYLGKNVILLDFWQTTCGPCVMLMPRLEEVANKFADRGLVYRAVNGGEEAAMIKEFLAATKIKAPIVLDPDGEISRAYLVEGIPQTVLIGKDGKVHVVHTGYSDALPGEISKEIEALLAGNDLAGEQLGKHKKPLKQLK